MMNRMPKTLGAFAAVGAGVALGAFVGVNSGSAIAAQADKYEVNESGQTFGSGTLAPKLGYNPDLIGVVATNGQLGYARTVELNGGPLPETLEEAARWNETHGNEAYSVPVFKSDGKTLIGEFVVTPANISLTPHEDSPVE